MSKFARHIGSPEPLKIDDEIFYLKPLGIEDIGEIFRALSAFPTEKGLNQADMLKKIDFEGLSSIKNIIQKTLEKSYPNEDKEEMSAFGLKYMIPLFQKIVEMNMDVAGQSGNANEIQKMIEKNRESSATNPKA